MKIFNKVLAAVVVISFMLVAFGLTGPVVAQAATSPTLGSIDTYGIVSSTWTNSANAGVETAIYGDVCYSTPPGTAPISIKGVTDTPLSLAIDPCDDARGTEQSTALADLKSQADAVTCTDLGVDVVLAGTYAPGCYTSSGTMDIVDNVTVTLSGVGTYIFRSAGALTTGANSKVVLADSASACDVFWAPGGATVLGAISSTSETPTFVGNIIQNALTAFEVSLGQFVNLSGRVLAFGRTVTTNSNTITVPTCAAATATPAPVSDVPNFGTITVVKNVINNNGGTKTIADFPLFVSGTPVVSGVTNTFHSISGVYSVTETIDPNYTQKFSQMYSGDCDANGQLNLTPGQNKFCILTNNDIGAPVVVPPVPPLIDVVKVPSPLALPAGPGPVTYTYTLKNIGTVPVTDLTMVGDTCSPITLVSGDTNNDAKLDVSETWIYRCSTTLAATHTNIVTTTGWANGISAIDIASATVVVGAPSVPPLIHVTKVPNPLTLPAKGGEVTYTEKITNPGTVALSNVNLTDDKCSPMRYISGDANGNSKLETNETWLYTCSANLTKNTTNTATATGEANGMIAKDLAVVTVIVAAPGLPNTGFLLGGNNLLWSIIIAGIIMAGAISFVIFSKKREI